MLAGIKSNKKIAERWWGAFSLGISKIFAIPKEWWVAFLLGIRKIIAIAKQWWVAFLLGVRKIIAIAKQWWVAFLLGYIALGSGGAVWIHFRDVPKGRFMNWAEVKNDVQINAKPEGIWTLVDEYVRSPALIQIEANDDEWEYTSSKKCGANGDLSSTLRPQDTILPSAPVGAMIAKVGGSTAGTTDGRLFVVGKKALLQLDQNTSGPLFLTINDQLSGLQNNSGSIKVKVSIIYVPQVPSAAAPASIPQPATNTPGAPIPGTGAPVPGAVPGGPIPGAPIPTK